MHARVLGQFFEAHGFTIAPGTLATVAANDPQAGGVGGLRRRILDLAPPHLVALPFDSADLDLVPTPALAITADGELVGVDRAGPGRVRFSREGADWRAVLRRSVFEDRFSPRVLILCVLSGQGGGRGVAGLVGGFVAANRARFLRGFVASLMANLLGLAMPIGALLVVDKVISQNGVATLDVVILCVVIAEGFRLVLSMSRDQTLHRLGVDLEHEHLALYFHRRLWGRSGGSSAETVQTVQVLRRIKGLLVRFSITLAADVLFLVVVISLMFSLSPLLAQITIAGLAVVAVVVAVVGRWESARDRAYRETAEGGDFALAELLRRSVDLQAMGRTRAVQDLWSRRHERDTAAKGVAAAHGLRLAPANDFCLNLLRAVIIWFGAQKVLAAELTLGQFVGFNLIAVLMFGPVRRVADLIKSRDDLQRAHLALSGILAQRAENDERRTYAPPPSGPQELEMRAVRIALGSLGRDLLAGVDFTLHPGEKVAVLGPSGSGKSTFLAAVLGLHPVAAGSITFGGVALGEMSLTAYRRRFGVMRQTPLLLPGRLDEVLTGGVASDPLHVDDALRRARILERVRALPDGLAVRTDVLLQSFSRGEQQRVCLACALLAKADTLLLDEPTSGLDIETEDDIGEALAAPSERRAMIVVTHSVRLARRFDTVYSIAEGRLRRDTGLSAIGAAPTKAHEGRRVEGDG